MVGSLLPRAEACGVRARSVDSLVVGHARAKRVGHAHIARPVGVEEAGDAEA